MIAARQAPLAVGLGTLVSSGALFFINPASGIFPACPSQMFFGIDFGPQEVTKLENMLFPFHRFFGLGAS